MRVHFARLRLANEDTPVAEFEQLAELDGIGEHDVSGDPDSADLILFTQCHMLPTDWKLRAIREHPVTARHRDKVMIYDERDRPWCGFPGVYVSMPARDFDNRYQRAWGYFRHPQIAPLVDPDLLFSFIGSPSDRSRKPLFGLRHPDAVVEEIRRFTFFDPSSPGFNARRSRFQEILGRSRFVLCPRGRGTSSIRLYETLAAGRVPVIISDDWVQPRGPEWEKFSIRWPEGRTEGLVEMLEERVADWPAMSAAATASYCEFFSAEVSFHRIVDLCSELHESNAVRHFPRAGVRDHAFLASGADVVRWRTTSAARRIGKKILRRMSHLATDALARKNRMLSFLRRYSRL
jgi:hypothetical protein